MRGRTSRAVENLIRSAYAAFNARQIDAALGVMHDDVDWPNLIEGTRVHGHDGIREYWSQQFATIDPHVEPIHMKLTPDGRIAVDVHQVVHDLDGNLLVDQRVQHIYTVRDGLIERMDVQAPSG